MTVIRYHERKEAIQYTGSNSAAIHALIYYSNIISEAAGVLTIESGGPTFVVNTDDWVCWVQGTIMEIHNTTEFNYFFTVLPQASELAATQAQLDALEATVGTLATDLTSTQAAVDAAEALLTALQASLAGLEDAAMLSVGAAAVPLLLAGASTTVAVGMYPSLPDTSYTPHTQLFGGINLGPLEILSSTPTSVSNVDVAVRNNGLLSLTGATLLVAAVS